MRFNPVQIVLVASLLSATRADASALETPLEVAVGFLEIENPLPDGWTVRKGETNSGKGAETVPSNDGGGTITIDPEAIAAAYPSIDSTEANLPGVLYIFLYHEWFHANEHEADDGDDLPDAGGGGNPPYNTTPRDCGDVQLIPGVAGKHCSLICAILPSQRSALCDLYDDIRESYNNGFNVPGGASTIHEKLNCPGNYPGDIPECECCSEQGQ